MYVYIYIYKWATENGKTLRATNPVKGSWSGQGDHDSYIIRMLGIIKLRKRALKVSQIRTKYLINSQSIFNYSEMSLYS